MRVSAFDYDLPEHLIAQYPPEKRSDSRLLAFDRDSGRIEHLHFQDILKFLKSGDVLVVNDTKVFKARLRGKKEGTSGQVEFLCLKPVRDTIWRVLCRPAKRIRRGATILFDDGASARVIEEVDGGERIVEFSDDPLNICDRIGELPLPPYIKRTADVSDLTRYQTVYSDPVGSVAAPTAGLHFTDQMLDEIRESGIELIHITLHVGWGTFKPVAVDEIEDHSVEREWYTVSSEAAERITRLRSGNNNLVAVGTTTTRALESWYRDTLGELTAYSGETDLFIHPPYRFNLVDKLVTNFHLPRSSLLMLVSAFAGHEDILRCYHEAVEREYRFFSYGDAMMLL